MGVLLFALAVWFEPLNARLSPDDFREAIVDLEQNDAIVAVAELVADHRLVGLGETSHGQVELFDLKRRLTMTLIREHGFRTVYYETGNAAASVIDRYIQGEQVSLDEAMRSGFDMLIWQNAENAAFLEELRAWNTTAEPGDRVRFVGVDFQNVRVTGAYLRLAFGDVDDLITAAEQAVYAGEEDERLTNRQTVNVKLRELRTRVTDLDDSARRQANRLLDDIARFVSLSDGPYMRDRGMAESLLDDFKHVNGKAVFWAHNAHVFKGPLTYLFSDEHAAGGVLNGKLVDEYHALGFVYGSGSFSALFQVEAGGWQFRLFDPGDPPAGALAEPFIATDLPSLFIDIDTFSQTSPAAAAFARTPFGHRWFGGYVAAVEDMANIAAEDLVPTVLQRDFDSIIFVRTTTATTERR